MHGTERWRIVTGGCGQGVPLKLAFGSSKYRKLVLGLSMRQ
jgi:hypothetical protein